MKRLSSFFLLFIMVVACTQPPAAPELPAAPVNLRAEAGNGEIVLRWDANGEAEVRGYNIYRGESEDVGSTGTLLNTDAPLTATEYTDDAVVNGVEYYYVVSAVGSGSAMSPMSDVVKAMPTAPDPDPDTDAPAPPANLTATPEDGAATLTWDASEEPDLAGYRVYRSLAEDVTTSGELLNEDLINTNTYPDSGLENDTTYYYVVTAVDTSGNESDASDVVSAMPQSGLVPPPPPPANLTATPGESAINLSWDAVGESDVEGYKVYRSLTEIVDVTGDPLNPTLILANVNTYTDTTAAPGTLYHYAVTAVDVNGTESASSNVVSASWEGQGSQTPEIAVTPQELIFSGVRGTTSAPQAVTISNGGEAPLVITSIDLSGANSGAFNLTDLPALPLSVAPGGEASFSVRFAPGANTTGPLSAMLRVVSNDPTRGVLDIGLYGLSAGGLGGTGEPPLQQVVTTLGYNINIGNTSLAIPTSPQPLGDEVSVPLFVKAVGAEPVTLRAVARYTPEGTLPFGYYTLTNGVPARIEVATIASNQHQTLNPVLTSGGGSSFDPGSAAFGVYANHQNLQSNQTMAIRYTQDELNGNQRAARVYPLKNRAGEPVPNSYLIAFEDIPSRDTGDYQDPVFVITNVSPAPLNDTTAPTVEIQLRGVETQTGVYSGSITVVIDAADQGGSGLSSVSYSLNGEAFQPYTAPFSISSPGTYSLVARATDGAGNTTATTPRSFRLVEGQPGSASIAITNLSGVADGVLQPGFFNDWLSFSRIREIPERFEEPDPEEPVPPVPPEEPPINLWENLKFQDVRALRIRNTDNNDLLQIADLVLSGSHADRFAIRSEENPDLSLPFVIAPGEFRDVNVRFVGSGGDNRIRRPQVHRATLTIISNAQNNPNLDVQLAGAYMFRPEGRREITLTQLAEVFGYNINIGEPIREFNDALHGEEVRSKLWTRADSGKPVYVRQLAAYHRCCDRQYTFLLGSGSNNRFQINSDYGQSILPPIRNSENNPAQLIVNSPSATFDIRSAGYSTNTNDNLGVRTWPVRDRNGIPIPNTYLVGQDFVAGGCDQDAPREPDDETPIANCDYQDNVYLITNIQPAP